MIVVSIGTNHTKSSYILMIKGHAEAHKDVCLAATTIGYTTAQCVVDMWQKGRLRKRPSIRLKDSDTIVVCKPKIEHTVEALHLFLIAQTGIRLLEHNFQDDIHLKSASEKSDDIEDSSTNGQKTESSTIRTERTDHV